MSERPVNTQVAYKDNTRAEEPGLPYRLVYFPGHYGAFIGFKKAEQSRLTFCSCAKDAIGNCFEMFSENKNLSGRQLTKHFPHSFFANKEVRAVNLKNLDVIYENKLCHECNRKTPSYRFCHEMYGGLFKQSYGWYIMKSISN